MKKGLRQKLLCIVAIAFMVFAVVDVGIMMHTIAHAFYHPDSTTTQNIIWLFSSRDRTGCIVGLVVTYLAMAILRPKDSNLKKQFSKTKRWGES